MCESCGCGSSSVVYRCEECGKESDKPEECCGKPMKKVEE